MLRRAAFFIATLVLCSPAAFAGWTEWSPPPVNACEPRVADEPSCTIGEDGAPHDVCAAKRFELPAGVKLTPLGILACANEMQNCACDLIGSPTCTAIDTAGNVVLRATKDKPLVGQRRVAIDPKTGEVVVMLDDKTAKEVKTAATYKNDAEIEKMRFENNTPLYRLTTSVALLDSSRTLADKYKIATFRVHDGIIDDLGNMGPVELQFYLQRMWEQIARGIYACHVMESRPTPDQPDAMLWWYRQSLVCAFRESSDLARTPVYASWPACRCNNGRGRMVGQVCLTEATP
ncbi:MAG: hypothetical protein HY075_15180, partial [Deltaproteobacteria bacterium]|nr:hypothetical protein [Deltaproteobacteria bacterium]